MGSNPTPSAAGPRRYAGCTKKRRITLNLDEDVVDALERIEGRSMSAVANEALRQAVAAESHRTALLRLIVSLDGEFGPTSATALEAGHPPLAVTGGRRGSGTRARL